MVENLAVTLARIDETQMIMVALIVSGCIAIYLIYSVRSWRETREHEQTRREIAAYVAEGTIKPDEAVKLLAAASDEAEKMIADGVAWGTIKPEKAERLIRTMRSGGAETAGPAHPQSVG